MREKGRWREWDRSIWILVIVIVLAGVFLLHYLFLWIFWVYGPINHPGGYKYEITVTGLSDKTGGSNGTWIAIPLPVKLDNAQIFQREDINNRTFGIWTSYPIPINGGTMVRFYTRERNLTDIHAVFYREEEGAMNRDRELLEGMSPESAEAPTPFTRWIYNQSALKGPVTLVMFGPGIEPSPNRSILTFELQFYAGGGTVASQERDWYRLSIVENIPGNMTGRIPVRVQAGKHLNNAWIPF